MASSRFTPLEGSIETFIEEQENQNTVKKTKRDFALFTEFLQTKGEARSEIAEIPPVVLNEPQGPTQSVWVADCYFIVNVLDLPFASLIAIYR